MREIRLDSISKSFDDEVILNNLNLTIPEGKFFALLGPSGSGKTTILRLIAGFEEVTSGKIYLGDEDITHVPIYKRRINTVFQQYALFTHLTIFENIAYGLRVKGVANAEVNDRVANALALVRLSKHGKKYPKQLSGGQQQRVALARALINEPDVLLLDEPFAALDVKLKEQMLIELINLQDKLKTTFVYVTHDQFEALTVADQIAIMNNNGEVEQIGKPKEIYEFPRSRFVATFVGRMNLIEGVLHINEGVQSVETAELGTFNVRCPLDHSDVVPGGHVLMSIRPEKILITKKEVEGFSNMLKGVVRDIIYYGRSTEYRVELSNGERLIVFEQNEEHFPHEIIDYDNVVYLYFQKENVGLLGR